MIDEIHSAGRVPALRMVAAFGGQVTAQEMLQSLGAGEGEVSIVAWAGYIERGETDTGLRLGHQVRGRHRLQGRR